MHAYTYIEKLSESIDDYDTGFIIVIQLVEFPRLRSRVILSKSNTKVPALSLVRYNSKIDKFLVFPNYRFVSRTEGLDSFVCNAAVLGSFV